MRELLLILGAACVASLPFVAFNEWFRTAPRHDPVAAVSLWSDDLRQANPTYHMPRVVPVSATIGNNVTGERR